LYLLQIIVFLILPQICSLFLLIYAHAFTRFNFL